MASVALVVVVEKQVAQAVVAMVQTALGVAATGVV